MKRSGLWLLFACGLGSSFVGCSAPEPVPSWRVERRGFEHRVTAEGELKAARSTPISVPSDVEGRVRLAWVAEEGRRVEAGEVVARFDASDLENALERGTANLDGAALKTAKTEAETASRLANLEKDARLAGLELDVARRFQKTDEELFSRHAILESQIDEQLASQRKEHAETARGDESRLGRTELELLAIEKRQAQLEIDRARRGLEALEVRAPHAGIFSLLRLWRGDVAQVGSELWQGQPIAEIPDLTTLQAEVFVLEADAGGLAVGRSAVVTIDAHPQAPVAATIRRVDSIARPRLRGSPVQYFGVTLALERTDPALMKPGQRVRASLLLETLDQALVVPRQAIYQEDGESWVQVRGDGGFAARKVKVGAASLGLVVIEDGLAEGEVVALDPKRGAETAS